MWQFVPYAIIYALNSQFGFPKFVGLLSDFLTIFGGTGLSLSALILTVGVFVYFHWNSRKLASEKEKRIDAEKRVLLISAVYMLQNSKDAERHIAQLAASELEKFAETGKREELRSLQGLLQAESPDLLIGDEVPESAKNPYSTTEHKKAQKED